MSKPTTHTQLTDPANGYEAIAPEFIRQRERSQIGVPTVLTWSQSFPPGSRILDLGCGTGLPLSAALVARGMQVYGIDASETLTSAFRRHLPQSNVVCERVEDSDFFGRRFDGVMAVGLMFLLSAEVQRRLIHQVAAALNPGGKFLFSAPRQACDWSDVLTGRMSTSLGAIEYQAVCTAAGLLIVGEYEDEGRNHYYDVCRAAAT